MDGKNSSFVSIGSGRGRGSERNVGVNAPWRPLHCRRQQASAITMTHEVSKVLSTSNGDWGSVTRGPAGSGSRTGGRGATGHASFGLQVSATASDANSPMQQHTAQDIVLEIGDGLSSLRESPRDTPTVAGMICGCAMRDGHTGGGRCRRGLPFFHSGKPLTTAPQSQPPAVGHQLLAVTGQVVSVNAGPLPTAVTWPTTVVSDRPTAVGDVPGAVGGPPLSAAFRWPIVNQREIVLLFLRHGRLRVHVHKAQS